MNWLKNLSTSIESQINAFLKFIGNCLKDLWMRAEIDIYRRGLIWLIVLVFFYMLFAESAKDLFDSLIVFGILKGIVPSPMTLQSLSIYLVFFVLCFFRFIRKPYKSRYKQDPTTTVFLLFLLFCYAYNRPAYDQYPLVGQTTIDMANTLIELFPDGSLAGLASGALLPIGKIGIFDGPFLLLGFYCIVIIANDFRFVTHPGATILTQDVPIRKLPDDRFNRHHYFNPLIQELRAINFDSGQAFAIGINSSWGYGKTSLLSILKQSFEDYREATVYMEYNPWMSTVKSGLTMDFFVQLNDVLSRHIETDNLIIKYGKALSKFDFGNNPLKGISSFLEGDESLKERHDKVDDLLLRTRKRFVIIIDDMDRLDNQEVMEVLRLIRNTANFPGLIFVAAYDKNYLCNALKESRILNQEKYLEKIFDLELMLPKIEQIRLRTQLETAFRDGLANFVLTQTEIDDLYQQITDMIYSPTIQNKKLSIFSSQLWNIIRNKRDIIRFVNGLLLSFRANKDWVYFPDLAILELIKMADHNTYQVLNNPDYYLEKNTFVPPHFYKLMSHPTPVSMYIGVHNRIQTINILAGKELPIQELLKALFEQAQPSHFNSDKALRLVDNFENYFIYAKKNDQSISFARLLNP